MDRWLAAKAEILSTGTLHRSHEMLNRIVDRAMTRDLVKRIVVPLATVPPGSPARPSKAFNLTQARAVHDAPS